MALRPRFTHIAPYGQRRVYMQWALDGVDPSAPSPVFTVEKSSNHFVDFETVATGLTDPFYIDDLEDTPSETINFLATNRALTYRIGVDVDEPDSNIEYGAAMDLDGNLLVTPLFKEVPGVGLVPDESETEDIAPHSYFYAHPKLNHRVRLLRRAKVRRVLIALRLLNGSEITVLKRRHFGERCETCWAAGPGMVVKSKCDTCYGTGWIGGYHTPLNTLAKVAVSAISSTIQPEGEVEIRQARIGLPPFPIVHKSDVIVELANNRRWIVRTVDPNVFRSRVIKQVATCTEIGRSSVAHTIPADLNNKYLHAFPD